MTQIHLSGFFSLSTEKLSALGRIHDDYFYSYANRPFVRTHCVPPLPVHFMRRYVWYVCVYRINYYTFVALNVECMIMIRCTCISRHQPINVWCAHLLTFHFANSTVNYEMPSDAERTEAYIIIAGNNDNEFGHHVHVTKLAHFRRLI